VTHLKTYFINLDQAKDRYQWFMEQAKILGLDVERVRAVDGQTVPKSLVARYDAISPRNQALTLGELGCFLSHLKVWDTLLKAGDDWGFIVEDDVHLAEGIGELVGSKNWLPEGVDIVKAETVGLTVRMSSCILGEANGRSLRVLKSFHRGSGGYFLSRQGARRLIEIAKLQCVPVDHFLFSPAYSRIHGLETVQLDPAVCVQDSVLTNGAAFPSLLDVRRANIDPNDPRLRRPSGFAKILREVRRLAIQARNVLLFVIDRILGTNEWKPVPFK
jgi:glycosyl transferase, family 25